jgi:hypothetical protein
MLNLLKKISIQDVGQSDLVARFENIMEGVDGSAVFGFSSEAEAIQVLDNQTQQYKQNHTLDLRVIEDSTESAFLNTIIANGNLCNVVAEGIDGTVFMESVRVARSKQYDQITALSVQFTKTTQIGYMRANEVSGLDPTEVTYFTPVYASNNILDKWNMNQYVLYEGDSWLSPFATYAYTTSNTAGQRISESIANTLPADITIQFRNLDGFFLPPETQWIPAPFEAGTELVMALNVVLSSTSGTSYLNAYVCVEVERAFSGFPLGSLFYVGYIPNGTTNTNVAYQFDIPSGATRMRMRVTPASSNTSGNTAITSLTFGNLGLYLKDGLPTRFTNVQTATNTNVDPETT